MWIGSLKIQSMPTPNITAPNLLIEGLPNSMLYDEGALTTI